MFSPGGKHSTQFTCSHEIQYIHSFWTVMRAFGDWQVFYDEQQHWTHEKCSGSPWKKPVRNSSCDSNTQKALVYLPKSLLTLMFITIQDSPSLKTLFLYAGAGKPALCDSRNAPGWPCLLIQVCFKWGVYLLVSCLEWKQGQTLEARTGQTLEKKVLNWQCELPVTFQELAMFKKEHPKSHQLQC